jgi:hypothetical protein
MSLAMTKEQREAFLADVRVGVISIAADDGREPLTIPSWYSYEPGGEVRVVTARTSRKAQLLERVGRFSLCVQKETSDRSAQINASEWFAKKILGTPGWCRPAHGVEESAAPQLERHGRHARHRPIDGCFGR